MDIISYSAARSSLASIMDRVIKNHEPVIITRGRKQAVVMLLLEDYKAMEETAYLSATQAKECAMLAEIYPHKNRR
ncbi:MULTISPECIES: type II toxin-antitoxin system Phd/YefM family antitoxin [Xanthomonas]|uniref:Antitoxin n=1 Tax=Xanthomonas sacchari TaxID=56458 RepID=A0AA46SWP6_9XANT|nr:MULTISPECIES: type II toxin-antitoxin system Phd/YefM family antitoxin [Xanthomonas]MCW0365441.1 hypothetical protein [Xanthomonas sacchari]MCW0439505.1 hypothetical protein [Xanthomonas sacchari]MCW0461813.1 hypothetical protein [Xanthomonas sacchari]MDY4338767.1 type II toxin-antitoxin system Phd/YefM family antitoxin [Xanthomonas sp. LF07-6]UYK79809.1 type II toxin-antitoxin system Phd/YefM family antitoxin [Xanthomonas sacchari]